MSYNLYQPQPLKIEYGNLAQNINREELENSVKNPIERNRLYQLITRVGDAMQPAKSALEKAIFGGQEEPKITTNADGTKAVTVNNNRTGGLLGFANDVAKGFGENVSTPYNPNNLLPSKKGFAQRFGEGLGTATRLLDNSAVRGAIAYGLSKSLGDNNALEQGLTAASMNMAAKNNDKLYRNDLNNMGVDTSGINGYITEDMYKNILASRQMQENAEWRKANLLAQQQQNDILNNIRLRELNIKENEAKLGGAKAKAAYLKFKQAISDRNGAIQQIRDLRTLIEQNPQALGLIVGSLAKGNEISQKMANEVVSSNPEHIGTRAAVAKLRGTTMHDLLGSAQTLVEQKNLVPFLPDATDNPKTALAKLDQLEKEIQRELNNMYAHGDDMGWDYATQEPPQLTTNNAQPKTNDLPNVDVSAIDAELKRRGVL